MADKDNQTIFMYVLCGAAIFLILYLVITSFCGKKEGLEISSQHLLSTIGNNYQMMPLMTSEVPNNFQQIDEHTLSEDDALKFYCGFNGDQMRIGKTQAYQDARFNHYTKVRDMLNDFQ